MNIIIRLSLSLFFSNFPLSVFSFFTHHVIIRKARSTTNIKVAWAKKAERQRGKADS